MPDADRGMEDVDAAASEADGFEYVSDVRTDRDGRHPAVAGGGDPAGDCPSACSASLVQGPKSELGYLGAPGGGYPPGHPEKVPV